MRITSGSTAIARAMHRRCCWPPDRPMPGLPRRSLTSSHSPAPRSAPLDVLVDVAFARPLAAARRRRCRRSTSSGTGSASGRPCRSPRRTATTSTPAAVDVERRRAAPRPSARAPGISSCMRLMQRTTVDLPQPDGPISAVARLAAKSSDRSLIACVVAVPGVQALEAHGLAPRSVTSLSPAARPRVRRGAGAPVAPLHGGLLAHPLVGHVYRLLRWKRRAIRVSSRTIATSVSAAPHARCDEAVLRLADVVEDLDRAASSSARRG